MIFLGQGGLRCLSASSYEDSFRKMKMEILEIASYVPAALQPLLSLCAVHALYFICLQKDIMALHPKAKVVIVLQFSRLYLFFFWCNCLIHGFRSVSDPGENGWNGIFLASVFVFSLYHCSVAWLCALRLNSRCRWRFILRRLLVLLFMILAISTPSGVSSAACPL